MQDEKYHTLLRRFAASLIDLLVFSPFLVAILVWPDLEIGGIGYLALNLSLSMVSPVYFVVMHARTGQTIGKQICGVRVVNVCTEKQITWAQSLLREAPMIAFLAVFAWLDLMIFTHRRDGPPLATVATYASVERMQRFWNLGDALCTLFNSKRQSFHDYIGQTVVIQTIDLRPS